MHRVHLVIWVALGLFWTGRAAGQETTLPVHLRILVPADAQVWVEGARTTMRGPLREFVSPALPPGQNYIYTVRVQYQRDGQTIDQQRNITVKAGDFVELNYEAQTSRRRIDYSPAGQAVPKSYFSSPYDRRTGSLNTYGFTGR
jgi:uncharacterized protein (TIGR03000 family)